MGCREEACTECLQRCLHIHGTNKKLSSATYFVKVMIGDQFSKVLYLPPNFAAKMSNSLDQTTFLEDSDGLQWKVTTSKFNGSLAFQEGWSTFASDHDLQIGDFLVFTYIVGSHFFVKIFDKTACEKVVSPKNSCKKRTRNDHIDVVEVGLCNPNNNGSLNRHDSKTAPVYGSNIEKSPCFRGHDVDQVAKKPVKCENSVPQSVCREERKEELCHIINRDVGYRQEEEKSRRANLLNLEMEKSRSAAMGNALAIVGSESQPVGENGSKNQMIESNKISICDNDFSRNLVYAKRLIPPTIESKGGVEKCYGLSEVIKYQIDEVKSNLLSASRNTPLTICQKERSSFAYNRPTIKHEIIPKSELFDPRSAIKAQDCQYGETEKIIKNKLVEISPENSSIDVMNGKDENRVDEEISSEVGNLSPSRTTNTISCVVVTDQSFLVLPFSLPRPRTRFESKVVFLRDPIKRVWPVLYHELSDHNALTSGWEAFRRANDIQAGHECVFEIENESDDDIYEVSIRKS